MGLRIMGSISKWVQIYLYYQVQNYSITPNVHYDNLLVLSVGYCYQFHSVST